MSFFPALITTAAGTQSHPSHLGSTLQRRRNSPKSSERSQSGCSIGRTVSDIALFAHKRKVGLDPDTRRPRIIGRRSEGGHVGRMAPVAGTNRGKGERIYP
eukprot:443406-Pyramimonas_sp.AAC.1